MIEKLFFIKKTFAEFGGGPNNSGFSGGPDSPITNPLGNVNDINTLITKLLEIVIQIGLPVIALAIVYTGFLFIKARGNDGEISKAKDTLLWVVIGAAVILGAFVIQTAICGTIEGLGGTNQCG
ncbi:MAG: pilin [Patescibacteria group bacterium]